MKRIMILSFALIMACEKNNESDLSCEKKNDFGVEFIKLARKVYKFNDNQLLDNYVKAAMYVQQLYDMKARVNWVLDETDSLNYIPRTINNLRLLSNELRIFSKDSPRIISAGIDAHKLYRACLPSIE